MYNTERSEITHAIYDDAMTWTEERGERVEMIVDIYDCVDPANHQDLPSHTEKHHTLQHTGSVSVENRKHTAPVVCLCLLCFLLLTAVIVLYVCFTTERKQLLTHISNLTEEREQILTKYEQILNHNNNLTEEREQILTKYEQILNHNNNLTEEREQIKNKFEELQCGLYELDQRADNLKWIYYNFSFYYNSSKKKTWSDSRLYCQQKQADLVKINSREEQEFLRKVVGSDTFWIGLENSGEWKWTDGVKLANGYWSSGHPNSYGDCAKMSSTGWESHLCTNKEKWICERTICTYNKINPS
ncbi:asialoglycoprotein receptor 1 [Carassius gibelio]|uniref:asialoglycoprotein receptor 1 n=1 Tax=Carassius gibelio TaxID=101364 RepID=UPI002279436E|nr:asialoglycoprotein receptor 1 [Carassius gibelio]